MPTEVQFRRGTTAQNNSFTGAAGELSVNITNNSLRVHDGATAGGFELAKADLSNTSGFGTVSAANVAIGSTIVISSGFQLQNIQGLDATTTATIESAVAAAPNNFTSLNISGIGTIIGTFNVGTGGTVLKALTQAGISSVGIATATPTATLDVSGTSNISGNLTVGSATTIAGNSLKVGSLVEVTGAAFKFAGVEVVNATGIYFPTGIVTASRFTGELVGAAVTTVGGLHQNTGIATIAQVSGSLNGSVNAGLATVTSQLKVTGIATFGSSIGFAGLSTFYSNANFEDNVKTIFGNGGDLEIYHDGSNSIISDVGGGSLQINATPSIQILNNSVGISTFNGGGVDVAGGIALGLSGIATIPQIVVGGAVTAGSYGINVSNGVHIAGVSTFPQIVVGGAVTAISGGLDSLNVNVGSALTVVGVSTFRGNLNVGVNTSVGVVMTASNGTRYRLFVNDDGTLGTAALS